jgi:hypothetical protein
MINRVGLTGAVRNLQSNSTPSKVKIKTTTFGRVKDIILDENHPRFSEFGEWNGLGTIIIDVFDRSNPGVEKTAKPYSPQSKSFPIINEVVQLFLLPTPTNSNILREEYYYLPSYNIWNSPHHNALPNPIGNNLPPSQQQDYQQVEGGLVRRVTDSSTEIDLNSPSNPSQNTFIERSNIHPILPFAGDVLYEGRWGNSLRFGSTAKSNSEYKNNWSEVGQNGDPIVILRNGQSSNISQEGWVPITENINQDLSSIYLTSTQKLPIDSSWNNKFNVFSPSSRPLSLSNFSLPQILINSDRVVLNAKTDSILISGEKSFNVSVGEYINVNSKNLYIDSQNVRLGNQNATEPLLLGNTTIELFNQLLQTLNNLVSVLETDQIYPGGVPAPNTPLNLVASNTKQIINNIQSQLETTKSKISKTV